MKYEVSHSYKRQVECSHCLDIGVKPAVSKTGKITSVCSAMLLRFHVTGRITNICDINVSNNTTNLTCSNLHAFFWVIPQLLNYPQKKHTTFRRRRKFEIKNVLISSEILKAIVKTLHYSHTNINSSFISARGKKKIFKIAGPLLMGLGAKILLITKIGIIFVGLLTLKALAVSKLALLLAGFSALQRLFGGGLGSLGGKNSWAPGGSSGWNSGGSGWNSGGTGGWASSATGGSSGYYRSFDTDAAADAHEMAYKAQVPQEVSQ